MDSTLVMTTSPCFFTLRIMALDLYLHQFEKAERSWREIEEKVNVRVSASLPACGWAKPRAAHADRPASDID